MASELPDFITASQPLPLESRAPWYKNTAPAYAGIVLWFVFWQGIVIGEGTPGGMLSQGIGPALIGLVIGALLCHFLYYLVPGLLGMKTGRPLYVVGTSTYGARGGLFMPGFLMGILQFGWIALNAYAVSKLLCACFGLDAESPSVIHTLIAAALAILGAFVGMKGIQYVGKVATYLPIIPLVILIILVCKTAGGLATFTPDKISSQAAAPAKCQGDKNRKVPGQSTTTSAPSKAATKPTPTSAPTSAPVAKGCKAPPAKKAEAKTTPAMALTTMGVIVAMCTYIVGFFATAGAAGVDMGMNNRHPKDIQLAGLTGVVLATVVAGGLAILVVAGAYGSGAVTSASKGSLDATKLLPELMGKGNANTIMILLAIAAFPPICFSGFIAANAMKTTLPKVNPWVSVGCGTVVSIVLAATHVIGNVGIVFAVIVASFGPVCGAMAADYLLAGRKWAGPRAGFNPAGWISWGVGLLVGSVDIIAKIPGLEGLKGMILLPGVAAFVVGFLLYIVLAKMGLTSKTIEIPAAATDAEPPATPPAEEPAQA